MANAVTADFVCRVPKTRVGCYGCCECTENGDRASKHSSYGQNKVHNPSATSYTHTGGGKRRRREGGRREEEEDINTCRRRRKRSFEAPHDSSEMARAAAATAMVAMASDIRTDHIR